MTTQIEPKSINRERPGAHEVLLAGLGAVSLIRKNAGGAITEAFAIAGRVQEKASLLIYEVGGNGVDGLVARTSDVGKRASAAAGNLVADIESRLQPLLRKFDDLAVGLGITVLKPKAKRKPAKSARKASKAVAKRRARKAA